MLKTFVPKLEVLSTSQKKLWPELKTVPRHFVLYGGTAVALRLGHRASVDFDFFSSEPFVVNELTAVIPFLNNAQPLQAKNNTFTVLVGQDGPVKVSFFGGLHLGRVGEPELTHDEIVWVASLRDLGGTKVAVIQQRAEQKDYLDLAALLRSGLSLDESLGAARALYPENFNPMISLKALAYFADGDLPKLPENLRKFLSEEASRVQIIPELKRFSEAIAANPGAKK